MELINEDNLEKTLKKDILVLSLANGTSMYPFIKDHTKIVLSSSKDINILDTILYKDDNRYVLHRVIGINDNSYIVLGDNCLKSEIIDKDNVLAVLAGYYKGNQYIEINDSINRKYFRLSKRLKPFIKMKYTIKSLFR